MDLEQTKKQVEDEVAEFTEAINNLDQQIQKLESHLDVSFIPSGKTPEEIIKQNQQERERRQVLSQKLNDFLSDKRSLQIARGKKEQELTQTVEKIRLESRAKVFGELTKKAAEITNLSEQLAKELIAFQTMAYQGREFCKETYYLSPQGLTTEMVRKLPKVVVQGEKGRILLDSRGHVNTESTEEAASNV